MSKAARSAHRAKEALAYWETHAPALREEYPEQFVAVHDGEVVASASDLNQLAALLERKGIALQDAWVRFITKSPYRALL